MKKGQQVVFWLIILVFAFSSILVFTSFSGGNNNPTADPRVVISPEEKQKIEDDKTAETLGQGMEGVLKKFSKEDATNKGADYYLDVGGVVLILVTAGEGMRLDSYTDKNVKIWGEVGQTTTDQQPVMKVTKVEVR